MTEALLSISDVCIQLHNGSVVAYSLYFCTRVMEKSFKELHVSELFASMKNSIVRVLIWEIIISQDRSKVLTFPWIRWIFSTESFLHSVIFVAQVFSWQSISIALLYAWIISSELHLRRNAWVTECSVNVTFENSTDGNSPHPVNFLKFCLFCANPWRSQFSLYSSVSLQYQQYQKNNYNIKVGVSIVCISWQLQWNFPYVALFAILSSWAFADKWTKTGFIN